MPDVDQTTDRARMLVQPSSLQIQRPLEAIRIKTNILIQKCSQSFWSGQPKIERYRTLNGMGAFRTGSNFNEVHVSFEGFPRTMTGGCRGIGFGFVEHGMQME